MNTKKQSKINHQLRSFVKTWVPTFLWVFIVCYLSLSDSGIPEIKFRFILESDKIAHIGIYLVLNILLIRSWVNVFSPAVLIYMLILSSVQVISFSIIMEVMQKLYTDTRHFDVKDIFANIAGTFVGAVLYFLIFKFFNKTSSKF